jgi:peptidyl-prolyl cis-trans isomerase C
MLKPFIRSGAALLLMSVAAIALAQDAPTRDTVVATVNGTDITLGQMIQSASQLPADYQQLPPDILFQGVMDQLIQQQLLAETLTEVPARVDISLANVRRSLLAGEVVNQIGIDAVTEEALQAAYDAVFAEIPPSTEYNAAHILVATEEEALAVLARIEGGEDFAALAQELSIDTGSGAGGGELGWFGLGMMVPEFEMAVIGLGEAGEMGALSAPVQSQFGWHVVRLNETRPQEPPTLDDVRAELEGQVRGEAIQSKLDELTAAATIVRPEEGAFDPALITNLDMIGN